jgi:hypothetical protein
MNKLENAILFSFDLSESVKIKEKIGDKNELLEIYYSKLVDFEIDFYELFIGNQFEHLSLDKLYLIKIIGDEYWYLYLGNSKEVIKDFIYLVQELSKKESKKYSSSGEMIFDEEDKDLIKHEYKLYIDKINLLESFANKRLNKLYNFLLHKVDSGKISRLDSAENNDYTVHKYLETLGLSSVIETRKYRTDAKDELKDQFLPFRFDPVGLKTDLFFRCTKEIFTPNRVHIGETLYEELESYERDKFEVLRKFIPKGISKEYTIYRLRGEINIVNG